MRKPGTALVVLRTVLWNPMLLRVPPKIGLFLLRYIRKFRPVKINNHVVLHSHLPPLNSRGYSRFVAEHLVRKTEGPSHAQIGLTNACPQRCAYCYNRDRKGRLMDTGTIMRVISDLKNMGVVWLGFTGGEPLLNRDILRIAESAAGDCALKLFTTGCTLTRDLASGLKSAGIFSVSVSLDHWVEEEHDRARRYEGAFKTAMRAIDSLLDVGGIHVSVSAVLSPGLIRERRVEEYLHFLAGLGIHEAWLSETKPSVEAFWSGDKVITESERMYLCRLQDEHNKNGRMTVNYLGHFEGEEHFGCNAGNKMVYVDAFGDVSPCVFTPMNFGNVRETPIREIFTGMSRRFPSESRCFINKNFRLISEFGAGGVPIGKADSLRIMDKVEFGGLSAFNRLRRG